MDRSVKDSDLDKVSGGVTNPNGGDEPTPVSKCDNCFSQKCKNCSSCHFTFGNIANLSYVLFTCDQKKFDEYCLTMEQYRQFKNS